MRFDRRTPAGRRWWCVAVCLVAVVLPSVAGCSSTVAPDAASTPAAAATLTAVADAPPARAWACTMACVRWRPVLDRLDRSRARAYAAGRPRLLRQVYVPRSRVLARDAQMLSQWTQRAVTVSGARLRILDVTRLRSQAPSVRLRVVDRMSRATAHLRRERLTLPRDLPTSRVIVLRPRPGGWRIAAAVPSSA